MQIQAILFDRDHTLVYFDAKQMASIEAQAVAFAPGLPLGAALQAWTKWQGAWPRSAEEEPAFWQAFWGSLGDMYQLQAHEVEALVTQIGPAYYTCFAAYPESAAVLTQLHQAGFRLAILTNYELPSIDRTLAHAGLDPALFSALLSSATIGSYKPDPQAFLAALTALGVPPEACAFVDDLAENVAAARSIGMQAFQIDRSLSAPELATGRIHSLAALEALLLPPTILA